MGLYKERLLFRVCISCFILWTQIILWHFTWQEKLKAAGRLEDKRKEGRIILIRILKRWNGALNSSGSGQKQWQATASTIIKFGVPHGGEFLKQARNYQLLKKRLFPVETFYSVFLLIYVVGSKNFRPDQLFKVTEIKQLCYFST